MRHPIERSGNWFHYFTKRDDELTLVLLDLDFADEKPDQSVEWCTAVKADIRFPTDLGWSTAAESNILERLAEALMDAANEPSLLDRLSRRAAKKVRYVGWEAAAGVRQMYFYGASAIPSSIFDRVMSQPEFDNDDWSRKVSSGAISDASRSFYKSYLHPGSALQWLILNRSQLETRLEHGDDLDAGHDVNHQLSFPDESSRRRFIESVAGFPDAADWHIAVSDPPPNEPGVFPVTLTREQPLNEPTADVYVTTLCKLAEQSGGEYAGWGAFVLTPDGEGGDEEPGT